MARICVIEEEEGVRILLEQFLARLGHEVMAFASGTEALEGLRHETQDIGVFFVDVGMTPMSGVEFFSRLSSSAQKRVIFMTGGSEDPAVTVTRPLPSWLVKHRFLGYAKLKPEQLTG